MDKSDFDLSFRLLLSNVATDAAVDGDDDDGQEEDEDIVDRFGGFVLWLFLSAEEFSSIGLTV